MARLRGWERNNNPNIGTDLVIKKMQPGVDDAEGYRVEVYSDGQYKETLKVESRKKLKDLIDKFKAEYKTDKAFLNGMLFHITYQNEKTEMPYGKQQKELPKEKDTDEKMTVQPIKEKKSMIENIEETLYRKAALIERRLAQLFNPELPTIRTAEDSQSPYDELETERVINTSVELLENFMDQNQNLVGTPQSDDLFNAGQEWVADLDRALDEAEAQGAKPVDKDRIRDTLKKKLTTKPGYDIWIMNKNKSTDESLQKVANSTIIITDNNIDALLDSLDSMLGVNDTITDGNIENIADTLNSVSCATPNEISSADTISDEISKDLSGEQSAGIQLIMAEKHAIDMLQKRFYIDTQDYKYSGTLLDVVTSWALDRDVDMHYAELVYKFVEADFTPCSTLKKFAILVVDKYDVSDLMPYVDAINTNPNDTTSLNYLMRQFEMILRASVFMDARQSTIYDAIIQYSNSVGNAALIFISTIITSSGHSVNEYQRAINAFTGYVTNNFATITGSTDAQYFESLKNDYETSSNQPGVGAEVVPLESNG